MKPMDKIRAENNNKCCICPYSGNIHGLHFHHVNPKEKAYRMRELSCEYRARKEAQKCVLVCANCHAEIHSGVHSQEFIDNLPRSVAADYDFSGLKEGKKHKPKENKKEVVEAKTEIKEVPVFNQLTGEANLEEEIIKLVQYFAAHEGKTSNNLVAAKLITALAQANIETNSLFLNRLEKPAAFKKEFPPLKLLKLP